MSSALTYLLILLMWLFTAALLGIYIRLRTVPLKVQVKLGFIALLSSYFLGLILLLFALL